MNKLTVPNVKISSIDAVAAARTAGELATILRACKEACIRVQDFANAALFRDAQQVIEVIDPAQEIETESKPKPNARRTHDGTAD